jgi:IS5 family transposase
MSERKIGQLSFADGAVVASGGSSEALDRVSGLIDWQPLEGLLSKLRGGTMGAPGYPALLLFKALLLQRWHGLSDPALEEGLKDRLSFRRFVGLPLSEAIPDHTTLWRFRETLKGGLEVKLFAEIGRQIETSGFVLKHGTLIDASLIPSAVNPPKRPEGEPVLDADGRPASKLVASELDPDAAWTKKENQYRFGYKLHVAMDRHSRIIRRILFTPANINESAVADALICADETAVFADKAYDSRARTERLKAMGIENAIMRRGHPKRPLSAAEHRRNERIARTRGAIEPLFALFKNVYGFTRARYRGLLRNSCALHLAAIAMNLKRWATAIPQSA